MSLKNSNSQFFILKQTFQTIMSIDLTNVLRETTQPEFQLPCMRNVEYLFDKKPSSDVDGDSKDRVDISPLLNPTTLFDFRAYKNAITMLQWKNRTTEYAVEGLEKVIKRAKTFDDLVRRNLGEESDGAESFEFTPLSLCTDPNIGEELVRYRSPFIAVKAGLHFSIKVADGKRAFQYLLMCFSKLKTSFSIKYSNVSDRQTISLLEGVFTITYDRIDNDDYVVVIGNDSVENTQLNDGSYYQGPRTWAGKACNFANVLSVVENSFRALHGTPAKLYGTGVNCYGMDICLYTTDPCHEYDRLMSRLPRQLIGRIKVTPGDNGVTTEIYSGREVLFTMRIVR